MSFLKNLRRRSKAAFRPSSADKTSNSSASNGQTLSESQNDCRSDNDSSLQSNVHSQPQDNGVSGYDVSLNNNWQSDSQGGDASNNASSFSNGHSQFQDDAMASSTTPSSSNDEHKTPASGADWEHPTSPTVTTPEDTTLDSSMDEHKTRAASAAEEQQPNNTSTTGTPLGRMSGSCSSLAPRPRPITINSHSNRSSFMGPNSMPSNGPYRPPAPSSPFVPRIESIAEHAWVHQKILLISGRIGNCNPRPSDGILAISHTQDSFPQTYWMVRESMFKALVHLVPGSNKIRLEYIPPGPAPSSVHTLASTNSSWFNINYLPQLNAPPLHLAIVLGNDIGGRYATSGQADLDVVVRKFRLAAYLCQAFTGEQMHRYNFGRRCFRYEEEWQPATLSEQDLSSATMRSEAKVHLVRCDETVAQLRSLSQSSTNKDALFRVAKDSIKRDLDLQPGQKHYVLAMLLDNDWGADMEAGLRHAATASDAEDGVKMAMFCSHRLHAYPSYIEEVERVLTERGSVNGESARNGGGSSEGMSNWETATIGLGNNLREYGRVFGCPDGGNGIMGSDFIPFNRTFTVWEPYSKRTEAQGPPGCTRADEASWSRLEALRFRIHPCFRLPSDGPVSDDPVQVWPVGNGRLLIISASGVAFVEIFVDDNNEERKGIIEYLNAASGNIPKHISLTEHSVRNHLAENYKKSKKLKLAIHAGNLRPYVIEDFVELAKSKDSIVKLPKGQVGFKGPRIGSPRDPESTQEELVLQCISTSTKLLISIKLHLDTFVTGIEFCYEDSTSQLFGKKAAEHFKREFVLDTRRGEVITGFYLRYGQFVEGVDIWTSLGRKSGICGNPAGGSGHTLLPPRGYSVAGISGSAGKFIESFGLIIAR